VRISVVGSQVTPTPSPYLSATPNPTENGTATPEGQRTGQLQPIPGDDIDLDALTLNSGDEDLLYQVDGNNYHWLTPANEAMIGVFGNQAPDLQDCQGANMSTAPIAVDSLAEGAYLCYVTNQGDPGRALLAAVNPDNYALTLDLLTWVQP